MKYIPNLDTDQAAKAENETYRFNDDLLLGEGDRQQAQKLFPAVFHVLNHPELQALFRSFDESANAAKAKSRRFGLTAICLAVFSLLVTSAEPLYRDLQDQVQQVISFAAALAGILIPLGFHALGLDPAIASAPFVTTVTDVVGFFSFLGLASLWLR